MNSPEKVHYGNVTEKNSEGRESRGWKILFVWLCFPSPENFGEWIFIEVDRNKNFVLQIWFVDAFFEYKYFFNSIIWNSNITLPCLETLHHR